MLAGDVTLSAGFTSGEGDDSTTLGTAGTTEDAKDVTAGISYAVASGVTANIGWKDIDAQTMALMTLLVELHGMWVLLCHSKIYKLIKTALF